MGDNDQEWPDLGFTSFDISREPKIKPNQVLQDLEADILTAMTDGYNVALVGDSMGGYYAAYMAEKYHLPAVLINPLIKAYDTLFLNSVLEDSPDSELIKIQLQELETATTQPDSMMVMLQKKDLLQDYKLAKDYYHGCNQIILNGGSHQVDHLQDWTGAMTGFFTRHYAWLNHNS